MSGLALIAAAALLAVGVGAAIVLLRATSSNDDHDIERRDFRTTDARNGRAFVQSNIWNSGSRQYAVWIDSHDRAFAGVRTTTRSDWDVVDLAEIRGNPLGLPVEDDDHNVFAIAVDANGYVHIAGNMHSDELRYVRSTRPHDLSSLRDVGAPDVRGPVTYPRFVGQPSGGLLFFRREGGVGSGATVLDRLGPDSSDWERVGPIIDGRPSGENPYLHNVAVDPGDGTVHLLFMWRGGRGTVTNNDLTYARSDDGGVTWTTASGEELPTPITHGVVDPVIDTKKTGSGLINSGGFTVDANGHPIGAVAFGNQQVERVEIVRYDGETWTRQIIDDDRLSGRPSIVAAEDVWLVGVIEGDVAVTSITADGLGEPLVLGRAPSGWEAAVDAGGIADGSLELLMPRDDVPVVVAVETDDMPPP